MTVIDHMHEDAKRAELRREKQREREAHDRLLAELYQHIGRPINPVNQKDEE